MARQLRSHRQNGWHHVTNRGLDRQAVFRSVDDRLDFGRLLGAGCAEFDIAVFAYCLMDNHFHLVLDCPEGGLSSLMQHLGAKFTRHANERRGGDGPIFRGRFFSRRILSNEYLLNAVRYVHRNPLDIRPAVDLAEYRWSSHRTHLGLRPRPSWLALEPVSSWFDSPSAFAEFVESGDEPVGVVDVDAADLVAALDHVVDELGSTVDRAPQGLARTASYLLLDRVSDRTSAELGRMLASSSEQAAKQAIRRARRLARADPLPERVAQRALELVGPAFRLCLTQLERQSQVGRLAS